LLTLAAAAEALMKGTLIVGPPYPDLPGRWPAGRGVDQIVVIPSRPFATELSAMLLALAAEALMKGKSPEPTTLPS
jgi:hypothetical protein